MNRRAASADSYHPTVDGRGRFVGGGRNFAGRLKLLEEAIEFSGKRVLDLGCSGGFFSFSLAEKARSVLAIDADAEVIEVNNRARDRVGYTNVEFLCARITPELMASLPEYDVVLFLSVFHHLAASSETYEWTRRSGEREALAVIEAIRARADTFVFETGRSDEGFPWCQRLEETIGEPREWVSEHVFDDRFQEVRVIQGAAYQQWPFSWFPAARRAIPPSRFGRRVLGRLGVDVRDFREIYVGYSRPGSSV